jgi:hypothetical protein
MSADETVYNLAAIRELLLHAFTATTLHHFCQDRPLFRPMLDYVSQSPSKAKLVDTLLEHRQTQLLWEELLAEVQFCQAVPAGGRPVKAGPQLLCEHIPSQDASGAK